MLTIGRLYYVIMLHLLSNEHISFTYAHAFAKGAKKHKVSFSEHMYWPVGPTDSVRVIQLSTRAVANFECSEQTLT